MYNEKHFSRDVLTVDFDETADGVTVDDGETDFDWSRVEVVTIDEPPYETAFDATRFYRLDATVAKPMAQPYQYGEDTVWLKKPRDELKQAAWSMDNAPWTLGHPETGMVKSVDDVHGFWSDPRYDEVSDNLDGSLLVPVDDRSATKYLEEHDDVSVGFYNRIVKTDEYDGTVGGTDDADPDIDGYQTELLFDHVASVPVGRCPSDAGCGIGQAGGMAVADSHGHLDATTSLMSEKGQSDAMSVGEWVEWDASGGTAYGKVDEIIRDGCTTRGKGDREVCAEDDDPAVVVEVYDDESGESTDEMVRHKMSELRSWTGPSADSVARTSVDESDIDMVPPEAAQENAQMALDAREETGNPNDCGTETGWRRAEQLADGGEVSADVISKMAQFNRHRSNSEQSEAEGRKDCGWMMWKAWGGDEGVDWAIRQSEKMESSDSFKRGSGTTNVSDDKGMRQTVDAPSGLHVADGTWFAVGPDEHPDESTEWPDDAKYPVDSCEDINDAWNLRGSGDISIEQSTLAERIKRAAEAKDCDLPDTAEMDAASVAASAKRYSVCGSRKHVMRDGLASLPSESESADGDCGCGGENEPTDITTMEFDFDDLSTEAALARVESQHDGVAERLDDLRESVDEASAAREAVSELDIDDASDLADTVAMMDERIDELTSKIDELQRPQMEEDAAFIAEKTDRFGDSAEDVLDALDEDPDEVSEKRDLVEELTDDYEETTANPGGDESPEESYDSTTGYAKTPW
jgi:hypothetical protein